MYWIEDNKVKDEKDFNYHFKLFIQVSTRSRQNKKTQALLSCNRKVLRLPDNVPAVHLQFTEYYFPDNPNISGITQLKFVFLFISDMYEESGIFASF